MSTTERKIAETDGSRRIIFIIVTVISLLLILGLFFWMRSASKTGAGDAQQQRLEGGIRAGTPEFEQYRQKIVMDKPEATEAKRPLGDTVMRLTTTVRNFSGRSLNGLEVYAAVVDIQGKPIKERTLAVIPARRPELDNNETLEVPITLEGFKDTDDRANIKMEITAIRFK
jgi:flagellar basal body-associated protein FliL